MKKAGLIILALVAIVGFAVRGSDAGPICIDEVGYCNDLKLFINPHGAGKGLKINEVHGYEYGCGYDDRGISGSMKETSTTKYFTLVGSYSGTMAKILYFYIDKHTNTGAGTWTYIGLSGGSTNFNIVECPATGITSGEAMAEAHEEMAEPDDTEE
jgi:hypothetical protein